ncbi:Gag-pol Polyprotein [Phytophthora megakarya]|uniref:Gag-pol Polyprotein n=1 Tax=Phytophthora megakarya TaxID=4795 RepID=A0A225WVL4_9STRA|nr:Gag-pol Polyprotein [Phytophthora megakarya]
MHDDHPNELVHRDYLYKGKSDTTQEYALVIKDDTTRFTAGAEVTFTSLMEWFASVGVCRNWVGDPGIHSQKQDG